ncbi:MAG TPA: hypothetical protein VKY56_04075 [Chloroflexota bacterium]|nr:hypothetical protein [Chloroflexota bacterium]
MRSEPSVLDHPAVVRTRPWSAIDDEDEARIERELQRPVPLRERLFRWLLEYNKY